MAQAANNVPPLEETSSDAWMKDILRLNKSRLMALLKILKPVFLKQSPSWDPLDRLKSALKYFATGQGYEERVNDTVQCINIALRDFYENKVRLHIL